MGLHVFAGQCRGLAHPVKKPGFIQYAILGNVQDKASAIIGNFGVSDGALFDVLTGKAKPQGKLPFELPSSMAEVQVQKSDVPYDTARPLYKFGYGLSY